MHPWIAKSRSIALRTRIFSIRQDTVSTARSERSAWVIEAPDWVNIIAVTPDQQVVLVRQYRHGIACETIEIPGGAADPGETPLQAAQRELAEETGYTSCRWSQLGVVDPNPAIQNNKTYTFLARDAAPTAPPRPDDDEEIEVVTAALADVKRMLRDQTISHALVLCAFAHWMLHDPSW